MAYKSWNPERTLFSTLNINVKSHKCDNEVKCRDIQANALDKLGGLSRWLSWELRKRIKTMEHILKDSSDLVKRLRDIPFPGWTLVQTADIEHFFMSGTAKEIKDDIREHLETEIRPEDSVSVNKEKTDKMNLTIDALEYLLFHQYVVNEYIEENRVWKTCLGTGMGRKHSGEVADVAFYQSAKGKSVSW